MMKAASLQQAGDPETAAKLTEQAIQRLDKMNQFFSVDSALTVAVQLQAMGQEAAAIGVLKSCVESYGDDPKVMERVGKLTDDPSVLNAITEAVTLNRQGVRSYQEGSSARRCSCSARRWVCSRRTSASPSTLPRRCCASAETTLSPRSCRSAATP